MWRSFWRYQTTSDILIAAFLFRAPLDRRSLFFFVFFGVYFFFFFYFSTFRLVRGAKQKRGRFLCRIVSVTISAVRHWVWMSLARPHSAAASGGALAGWCMLFIVRGGVCHVETLRLYASASGYIAGIEAKRERCKSGTMCCCPQNQ